MQNRDKLLYQNIEKALVDLNAKDKGRYFLCTCPECQQQEAFIYKNNPSFILCNRQNQCGERMILHFEEKEGAESYKKLSEEYPNLTNKQSLALEWMTRFMNHVQNHFESPTLDKGYRGLSKETTGRFIADLINEAYVQKMFDSGKELFPKNYSTNDWMCKRNLIFPIYGADGHLERILLRSSIDHHIEPKELQLIVNPSKETRDFFVDIPEKSKTVVIGEAILDAASFREVDPDVGVLALTGAAKTRKLCQFILENKALFQQKKFVLALDDDKAGDKATKDIIDTLEQTQAEYQVFPFPSGVKDSNAYLNYDKELFTEAFNDVKRSFSRERKYRDSSYLNKGVVEMER
ncbi:toprim domain-containing protein [Lederbergia citrea]|uniref:toprim domain-containing protein n=1 Tax=Lederbergia citrea TaxID=2833581 RepID=UPI001BC9DEC1|nr:toprim domain-containing protein [Lederbergia citrea]MBS4203667.1 toprim domain-containing protein [Lederbergia citrea]